MVAVALRNTVVKGDWGGWGGVGWGGVKWGRPDALQSTRTLRRLEL